MVDAQGRFLERTPACKTLWGEAAPAPRVLEDYESVKAWWPDSGQRLAVRDWALTRALTTGEVIANKEVEIETFDGQRKVVMDSAAPICDASGAIIGAVGVLQDITRRRRLEEALRQAEREAAARAYEFEAIFESIIDGVFVYDREGYILRANSAGRRLLNLDEHPEYYALSLAERIALHHICYEHNEQLPVERWPVSRMLRGEALSDLDTTEVSFRMLDGREVEGYITGAPLRDCDGHITGAVMVLSDQTGRQRLERRTHKALDALLAMAEALVQGTGEAAPAQGARSIASLVARRLAKLASNLLGYATVSISSLDLERGISEPLAVLGLSPEDEQRWWAGARRSALWMDGSHQEVLARLQAGETLVMDMNNPLLRDEPSPYNATFFLAVPMRIGERLVGLLILDPRGQYPQVTPQEIALAEATARLGALVIEWERLLREREAAEASAEALRQANQRMDVFLGLASHELKTPLTTVILGLQWGERRLQSLLRDKTIEGQAVSSKLKAIYDQITQTSLQAFRLDRLVNDLLDVSRIQTDRLTLRLEWVDLGDIIREVAREQRLVNPERCIQVAVPAEQSLPVCADAGRVEQVLTNYLTNALKYSAEDQPVEIGAALQGAAARLWVRDHGPGIPPAEQAHIWDRFHRVPGVEVCSGSGVGLGLGLYISKTIITLHHGQVGVESLPGEGATFWFTLPLSCPDEEGLAG
jgi:PAS domain S-box-containing protein